MQHFDRIDVSEGTDVNKTSQSKECDIFDYWYFFNQNLKFQPNVCNRYYDLFKSMRLSDIVALNTKGSEAKNVK